MNELQLTSELDILKKRQGTKGALDALYPHPLVHAVVHQAVFATTARDQIKDRGAISAAILPLIQWSV